MRAVFFVVLLLPFIIPGLVDYAFAVDTWTDAWNKIVGSDNVSNQMEHVTDGTKTNVIKNDRRR